MSDDAELKDEEIETERVAGDIILVLREGTIEERASLLRVIARLSGQQHAAALSRAYCEDF